MSDDDIQRLLRYHLLSAPAERVFGAFLEITTAQGKEEIARQFATCLVAPEFVPAPLIEALDERWGPLLEVPLFVRVELVAEVLAVLFHRERSELDAWLLGSGS